MRYGKSTVAKRGLLKGVGEKTVKAASGFEQAIKGKIQIAYRFSK